MRARDLGIRFDGTPGPSAISSLNGNGEMPGSLWIRETGALIGPVMITNTQVLPHQIRHDRAESLKFADIEWL